jgi:FAD/FMN-containing dehydrogenase
MTYVAPEQAELARLCEHIDGRVVTRDDRRYDEARQAWNLVVDQRPAAVAYPESARDVAAVVRFARANGFRVAPQATGHNAAPLGDRSRTILLKTERMRRVAIVPVARRARVQAGAIWDDVVQPAAGHGLTALHGSSPDVGVAGYALGGGVGWQVRSRGLAARRAAATPPSPGRGRARPGRAATCAPAAILRAVRAALRAAAASSLDARLALPPWLRSLNSRCIARSA